MNLFNSFKNMFTSEENQSAEQTQSTETVSVNSNQSENTEVIETTNSTNSTEENQSEVEFDGISAISKEEFDARLKEAIQKHLPENGIEGKREAQVFIGYIGRQIGNQFPDMPTIKVINNLGLMFEGKYQNDKMLQLIEDMPVGGYGY